MRKKTQQEKTTRQIGHAKARNKSPLGVNLSGGSNSGIFSNSGLGQKVDNKTGPSQTHAYAKTPGSQKAVRRSLMPSGGILLGKAKKKED